LILGLYGDDYICNTIELNCIEGIFKDSPSKPLHSP